MNATADVEAQVDALYAGPLDEFVSARNRLASQLRKEGEREAADRVKALAKPSVPAWAVNRLFRERRAELDALLDAGDRLRAVQGSVLAGSGQEDFLEATRAERDAVARLVGEARALLAEAGHAATDATLDRVGGTLHALAADEDARAQVGRLVRELDPTGFGGLGAFGAAAAAPGSARRSKPVDELAQRRVAKAEGEVERAAEEARAAEEEAEGAEARAEEARRAAEAAEKAAAKARRTAEGAADRLRRAEAALEKARGKRS